MFLTFNLFLIIQYLGLFYRIIINIFYCFFETFEKNHEAYQNSQTIPTCIAKSYIDSSNAWITPKSQRRNANSWSFSTVFFHVQKPNRLKQPQQAAFF